MPNKLLLAATAIALLGGTAAASAQDTYQHIQSRDFRQSQGDTQHRHRRGNYSYYNYGSAPYPSYTYGSAPYAYDAAPGYYVAPGWGYRGYRWGW